MENATDAMIESHDNNRQRAHRPIEHEAIRNHNKAVFKAFEEAINEFIPIGVRKVNAPWTTNQKASTHMDDKHITPQEAKLILQKAKNKVLQNSKTLAGTRKPPPRPVPKVNPDDL